MKDIRNTADIDREFLAGMASQTPGNIHVSEKPKGGGLRFDDGKPRTDLLSPIALMGLSAVLARGAKKYGDSNWRKGMVWSKVIGPLLRHTLKFMAGEDYDVDKDCEGCQKNSCVNHTGLPNVDLILTNAMFLSEYFRKHKDLDDRFKSGLE
jgi:hypothetical protein